MERHKNPAEQAQFERSRFSALHTRTYEAELLISAAVVFGLVQMGPWVARHTLHDRAGVTGELADARRQTGLE